MSYLVLFIDENKFMQFVSLKLTESKLMNIFLKM